MGVSDGSEGPGVDIFCRSEENEDGGFFLGTVRAEVERGSQEGGRFGGHGGAGCHH